MEDAGFETFTHLWSYIYIYILVLSPVLCGQNCACSLCTQTWFQIEHGRESQSSFSFIVFCLIVFLLLLPHYLRCMMHGLRVPIPFSGEDSKYPLKGILIFSVYCRCNYMKYCISICTRLIHMICVYDIHYINRYISVSPKHVYVRYVRLCLFICAPLDTSNHTSNPRLWVGSPRSWLNPPSKR